MALAVAHFCTE